jgi:hypothetical protein
MWCFTYPLLLHPFVHGSARPQGSVCCLPISSLCICYIVIAAESLECLLLSKFDFTPSLTPSQSRQASPASFHSTVDLRSSRLWQTFHSLHPANRSKSTTSLFSFCSRLELDQSIEQGKLLLLLHSPPSFASSSNFNW